MKKTLFALFAVMLLVSAGDGPLKDGHFSGTSRAIYTDEPYYGQTYITIENGRITEIRFYVRDSVKHEYFDDQYERYFADNELYVQQCRNDRKGLLSYPDSLLKYQDLNKVDVISGATWSYTIFKASAKIALSQAEAK